MFAPRIVGRLGRNCPGCRGSSLRTLVFALVLLAGWPSRRVLAEPPCTNGSFEQLDATGFPVDWAPVGQTVEVTTDAHTGRYALRLKRTPQTRSRATGLNRRYRHASGQRGAMIDRVQGGIDFWYKAVSAENVRLVVCAIPMSAEGIENTDSPRARFTVPDEHIGDDRWHHARLRYDFSRDPKVKWVHFAARIEGTAGELLLDDFAYVERVGPLLRLGRLRLREDEQRPGQQATVRTWVENVGDEEAGRVEVELQALERPGQTRLLAGLAVQPERLRLERLKPGQRRPVAWTLTGSRTRSGLLRVTARTGDVEVSRRLTLKPELSVRSFGPCSPVALRGQPVRVECEVQNAGTAFGRDVEVRFHLPTGEVVQKLPPVPPSGTRVAAATFVPAREARLPVTVSVRLGDAPPVRYQSEVLVVSDGDVSEPSGRLSAVTKDRWAVLENANLRLVFRRSVGRFAAAELVARTPDGWKTAAWTAGLGRVVLPDRSGKKRTWWVEPEELAASTSGRRARVEFRWHGPAAPDGSSSGLTVTGRFELTATARTARVTYELLGREPVQLLAFEPPVVYVLERDEAVFPGLEWLVGDEVSSSTLDIAAGHPHQVRYVVHPNQVTVPAVGVHSSAGTVGLLWDVHQKWDGRRDRPAVVFASPDRFNNQRSHLFGLFVPTVPEFVEPNRREASRPCRLRPGQPLRLQFDWLVDGTARDALAAVDCWLQEHGLPAPAPLPHGSYDAELQFCMQAYLRSLWVPETEQWWTTKGNRLLSRRGRPRAFVADLLVGAVVCPDAAVRRACRQRAEQVLQKLGGLPFADAQRFAGRADWAMTNPLLAARRLATRAADHAWHFDADHPGTGPFVGKDYSELGPDEAVEVGTCARKAFEVLRYSRAAGDRAVYERMVPTLERMESFRVPRAAQVWEVPVHTPDVLAAADAVDAYVEAYRLSGCRRWLEDAVTWARRGLPFIYLWSDPERPWLAGASIPVFGATWYQGSWFGRPVQWNGLRYANALLKLAPLDQSRPWRALAELIVRSAIRQQEPSGPNVALWPDNISAIDGKKSAWIFAPRQIIRNILKLTGRDEDPSTTVVGSGRCRICLTTTARLDEVSWTAESLRFRLTPQPADRGLVVVANLARPDRVLVDGAAIPERSRPEDSPHPGWRYDPTTAFLTVCLDGRPSATVAVEPAKPHCPTRLPRSLPPRPRAGARDEG